MSSATNSPAITGVSNPNPQMLPGGTPPGGIMSVSQPWEGDPADNPMSPDYVGTPLPTGKGAGPSVPTTPSPPPGRGGRSPGDVRPLDTPGAPIAQSHDIAQRFADVYNQMGQGGGQPPVPLPPRVLDPDRPTPTGPSLPSGDDSWLPQITPFPSPWMGQGTTNVPMISGAKPLQGMRANFPPGLPTKRPDVRTGPRSKYPPGALTRPPAIPMRDPTMPSPSTGYSIPFGKRRRGLV